MVMQRPLLISHIWLVVLLAARICNAYDEPDFEAIKATFQNHDTPGAALDFLQRAHEKDGNTFVVQKELDCLIQEGGGGACASAAGIDTLQALRLMAGLNKVANPHKAVLAAFADQEDLLQGRVTNEQFVKLLTFYQSYIEGLAVAVDVESAPDSPFKMDKRTWPEVNGPRLSVAPRQIRILSYTVSEPKGKVFGRHFVLLKRQSKNQIDVLDPGSPLKDRTYIVEHRQGDNDTFARIFLLNPAGIPRAHDYIYQLNTVFTVSIMGDAPSRSVSVEEIKQRIDETAAQLRDTDDFANPRVWRRKGAAYGLPALDLPPEYGGLNWPATKMIEVFKHAGEFNLNLRDVVGGAHVRPLLKSKKAVRHFNCNKVAFERREKPRGECGSQGRRADGD